MMEKVIICQKCGRNASNPKLERLKEYNPFVRALCNGLGIPFFKMRDKIVCNGCGSTKIGILMMYEK